MGVAAPCPGADLPFTVHEPLGRGRCARAFRATDLRTGAVVALLCAEPGDDDLARGFAAQQEVAGDGVAPVYALFDGPDGARVSMALASGSVARASPAELDRWLLGLVDAIARVHTMGWVHRDVKPSNLLWIDGVPCLSDFGAAVRCRGEVRVCPAGTPAYMAPEAFLWRVGPPTDWYALGVSLHELLTGRLPFDADSLQEELLCKQVGRRVPVLLPRRWSALLDGLLDPDPGRRWDAARIRAHLTNAPRAGGAGRAARAGCRGVSA